MIYSVNILGELIKLLTHHEEGTKVYVVSYGSGYREPKLVVSAGRLFHDLTTRQAKKNFRLTLKGA